MTVFQVGILGMGGIGRAFARRVRALGMTVIYHNRSQLSPELEDGATYVSSLDELLAESDVVSLNLPLNAKTKHTMGAEQFKKMKKSAILINTARGGVVNEQALVDALEAGEIAGCGLDVYEVEPNGVNPGLLKSDKAFLLPHVGYVVLSLLSSI
jgi:lactate dehydrogenase-like 2-hydroxyacid dehydrogenase